MLETGLMKMGRYGGVSLLDLNCLQILWCGCHLILIFIIVALACKIFRAFVFVRRAKILISPKRLGHVTRGILVKFLVMAKDDNGDIDGAKDSEFMRLLKKTTLSLQKCD